MAFINPKTAIKSLMALLATLIQTNAIIFAFFQHHSPSAEDPHAREALLNKPFSIALSVSCSGAISTHGCDRRHYHSAMLPYSPNTYTLCYQPCVFTSLVPISVNFSIAFCPLLPFPHEARFQHCLFLGTVRNVFKD
ncbi:hypothetical protein EI94DRAFT_644465 [Lactarius quietus]|nr:hypothetical protein EI94DRAFT_644465 [Lactarius quietus]